MFGAHDLGGANNCNYAILNGLINVCPCLDIGCIIEEYKKGVLKGMISDEYVLQVTVSVWRVVVFHHEKASYRPVAS